MTTYSPQQTLREALDIFFKQYNLGEEGGLNQDWAYLDFKFFRLPFPNTASRKRALIYHDIHHIVTGYKSDWQGEAEIGAWEVSTGCGDHTAAWVLDIGSLLMGVCFFPRKTFHAFIRGRRTLNLYGNTYTKEDLLPMKIDEVQKMLLLNAEQNKPATAKEIFAFIGWTLVSAFTWGLPFAIIYGLTLWYIFK